MDTRRDRTFTDDRPAPGADATRPRGDGGRDGGDGGDGGPGLARSLGLSDIILFGVGAIVGAGIYAIIGEAAAYGGNLLWASFLLAAVVAFLTAAGYAELVSRYPDAGGSFEYVKQAFGLRVATFSSVFMLFTGVVAAGAIAISFSSYLSRLIDGPQVLTTIGVVVAMGAVNALGAAHASWFNKAATAVTLIGLAAVVAVAGPEIPSVELFEGGGVRPLGLGVGAALIFFSFIGFEDLVKLAEETNEPERTMPRGILASAGIVLVIYLLVAVAAIAALGAERLADSPGPLAEIMEVRAGGAWATGIIAVALFATSKTILSNLLGTSRLLYDVARDADIGWLERLTAVDERTRTPIRAIAAVTVVAIGFGAIGDLRVVASFSNVLVMLVFLAVNVSLLRIRRMSDVEAPFRLRGSVAGLPVVTLAAIAGLLVLLGLNLVSLAGLR